MPRADNRAAGSPPNWPTADVPVYDASPRTNLYTSYSYTKNDSAVRLNAFANGESGRLFNLGMRHQF